MVIRYDIAVSAIILEDHAGTNALGLDRIIEPVTGHRLVRDTDDGRSYGLGRPDHRCIAGI